MLPYITIQAAHLAIEVARDLGYYDDEFICKHRVAL